MSVRANATLTLTPFTPSFADSELQGLKVKLKQCRDELPEATYASKQRKYGIEHSSMEELLAYWEEDFDWRKRETHINSVDHYTTNVEDEGDTFKIHLVAHFSSDPDAIPLLLNHGWPGSLLEYIDTIKILQNSTTPSFHLICPNQVGYGWSSGPPLDRGFGMYEMARILDKLMVGLGFGSGYAVQGGDIGSVIARIMSVKYEGCKAINLNYLPLLPPSSIVSNYIPTASQWLPSALSNAITTVTSPLLGTPATHGLTQLEIFNAQKAYRFASDGRAYGVLQGTRPGTAGIIMQSSPTALLAWLAEKFRDWVDEELSKDEILETVTVWWLLGTYPKAIYAYSELTTGVGGWHRDPALYLNKPFGFSSFAKEIASAPKVWAAQTGNLVYYNYIEKGGHFAALEQPALFAKEMQDCFGAIFPRTQ
ncbi:epoxide hydrolase [Leucosporidium creatinivorum]|uniref:Epoxide hydrolase n=1 Tax=Leucosporidium creatinivorum TaxID=106004 RepID=A0A1Y2DZ84_9BASI|nr:epoxide hydrolase [Leucosporidium creatinivorum]